MERVAFLIESSGERLGCMLNPGSLVIRRRAGIKSRESVGGFVTGTELADEPLHLTNGGCTELTLDLLFDITLPGSSITSNDVRDLTRPLWNLAENTKQTDPTKILPLCSFHWGKQWYIPGVITAIAERLEFFTSSGLPRRSWLRLILRRVVSATQGPMNNLETPLPGLLEVERPELDLPDSIMDHENSNTELDTTAVSGERLDQLAQRHYGDTRYWRYLAAYNGISNPLDLIGGDPIKIPALT